MRGVWKRLLGLDGKTVIEVVEYDAELDEVVASVRPRRAGRRRCGKCGVKAPGYDRGEGRRRWRGMDLGLVMVWLEADAPRVDCPEHGPTVAQVPWARHDAGFTRDFEDQVAWLTVHTSKSAVSALMRIAWRTVARIAVRVAEEAKGRFDPLEGLVRIGIDEIAHRRGQRYLTVVVDHVSGRLVWAHEGNSKKTLGLFFDALGTERCAQVELVSADGAQWIATMVAERCTNATLCLDPFHVVKWVTDALDEVRREVWNDARRAGQKGLAEGLKGARFALWKNPEDLTGRQRAKLSEIRKTNDRLYRAYLMKEQLRMVFHQATPAKAIKLLDHWLVWARRCQIPAFVKLYWTVRERRDDIRASLEHGLSNGRVESINQKIRVLTRVAFGFRTPEAMIAVAMLALGGLCPPLPGRTTA